MTRLQDLIGVESHMALVNGSLQQFAEELAAPVIGACHVTCSDEAQWECIEAFQRWFVQQSLPELKPGSSAPLHSMNLGGRYEWGAIRIAESHFATPESRDAPKLMVVKLNAHVGVGFPGGEPEYGFMMRYGSKSLC